MPAYNTGEYIGDAIESVLRQEGVDFELIVVDDGSEDDTAEVVQSFKDPRIKLIRNKKHMGIAYCHNVVMDESKSPFVAHVDSDHWVLPGAFQKTIGMLKSSPKVGQVHCNYFVIDEDPRTKDPPRKPDMDYKTELLIGNGVMNHLRAYRREVFQAVGKFDEKLKSGVEYQMALRIVDKYDMELIPEPLYCVRHKNSGQSMRLKELRFWFERLLVCRRLLKSNRIQFLKQRGYSRLMIVGLYRALRMITWRAHSSIINSSIYDSMINHFSWWPLDLFHSKKRKGLFGGKRIAYYEWSFPVLSQTFIHRELAALKKSGLAVTIIADKSGDLEIADENAKSLIEHAYYLQPLDKALLLRYRKYFILNNPLLYLNLFLYVVFHRYGQYKSLKEDKSVFSKAVYLAGVLKDKGINHIHSPWADRCAFVSLIAAKLLGATYSVQGRASDIHRKKNLYALPEKFENAEFVLTNTRYNESYIKSMVDRRCGMRVHTVYEGIDLEQFRPKRKENKTTENETRIITVARLIEEKGLVYLLKACNILKERGFSFRCDIIGGVQREFTDYYIELMGLHRHLGLEDHVIFSGAQRFKKVLEEYGNADIFVLPCVIAKSGGRDISPNTLIEAMAMELPVIATNIAAIPEIVEDDVSGILVPPNDENAVAEAMIRLIGDYGLRKELGKNARKRVEERFDIKKNIVNYVELFTGEIAKIS
jgi:glycosyltransferase involved in cell wall biosynthesis